MVKENVLNLHPYMVHNMLRHSKKKNHWNVHSHFNNKFWYIFSSWSWTKTNTDKMYLWIRFCLFSQALPQRSYSTDQDQINTTSVLCILYDHMCSHYCFLSGAIMREFQFISVWFQLPHTTYLLMCLKIMCVSLRDGWICTFSTSVYIA